MIREVPVKNAQKSAQKLYLTAFPKEERIPWAVLRLWDALGWGNMTAYYSGETFCGMAFTAETEEIFYVMFFAVAEEYRGQGFGSAILEHMKQKGKTVLLNVELPEETAPNYAQRLRRIAFYAKSGVCDTGYNIREVGGVFRVLSSTGAVDAAAYQKAFGKLSLGLWKPKITKEEYL